MRLSVAIQHHPARAELVPPLLAELEGLEVEVVADPDPEAHPCAWRTYRRALETTPEGATHRAVLQDDVVPSKGFAEALPKAVEAQPAALILLCVCGLPMVSARDVRDAVYYKAPFARLIRRQFVPTIGVVWPVEVIAPALEWVDEQQWPSEFTADDEIVGRIADALALDVLATAPSILQHPDDRPSLTGRVWGVGRGNNPGRQAAVFAEDASGIDWSRPPRTPF